MKFKITSNIFGKEVSAEVGTIAEAYEYVVAFGKANFASFYCLSEDMSEYMLNLVSIYNGQKTAYGNYIIKIERLDDPAEKGAANATN